jgi:hypothetical protein
VLARGARPASPCRCSRRHPGPKPWQGSAPAPSCHHPDHRLGQPFSVDGYSGWIRDVMTATGLPLDCKPRPTQDARRMLADAGASVQKIMAALTSDRVRGRALRSRSRPQARRTAGHRRTGGITRRTGFPELCPGLQVNGLRSNGSNSGTSVRSSSHLKCQNGNRHRLPASKCHRGPCRLRALYA